MNIFMPDESIHISVKMLDDKRLLKQILECYQLCHLSDELHAGVDNNNRYKYHPVFEYYFVKNNYYQFVVRYGFIACNEYSYRYDKEHKYSEYFTRRLYITDKQDAVPAYIAGQKSKNNQIIDTSYNCYNLYKLKLTNKWNEDKLKNRPPKWTNRKIPDFYN